MKRIRILQRKDGAVFTWTKALEKRPNMVPGWKIFHEDGAQSIELDRVTAHDLDTTQTSVREQALIEENARLREQLATEMGVTQPAASGLDEGEIPLPKVPEGGIPVLTGEPQPGEEPIAFVEDEEVPLQEAGPSNRDIQRMRKDDLLAYAREHGIEVPGGATRDELVQLCLDGRTD